MTDNIDDYLNYLAYRNMSPATIRTARAHLYFLRNKEMSKELVIAFQDKIQHTTPNSRAGCLTRLKQFLNRYYPDLESLVVIPKRIKRLPMIIPTEADVCEILKKPDTLTFTGIRARAMLELLYGSGLRRSEIVRLKLEELDLANRIIRINNSKYNRDRLVPMSADTKHWLEEYIIQVRPLGAPKTTHVFVSIQTGKPLDPGRVAKSIQCYTSHSPHKFRHAYATHLLRGGMKEVSLQRLLGHEFLESTQVYTKVTIQDLSASLNKHHPRLKWSL